MIVYIDYDDVIRATKNLWFDKYYAYHKRGIKIKIEQFIASCDWDDIIRKSEIISHAYDYIKASPLEIAILTKCHSLKEANAKIKDIRSHAVTRNVIIVPYQCKKTDVIDPKGNVLIDDQNVNLDDFSTREGYSICFSQRNTFIHNEYPTIHNLSILTSKEKVKKYVR